MISISANKKISNSFKTEILIVFCIVSLVCLSTNLLAQETNKYHAVIIRAAGYLPNTEKPSGEDAITNATSEPGNTYVFSDALCEILSKRGINTKVIDFSECRNLSCLTYSDNEGHQHVIDILIFAGPSYGRKMPEQILNYLPELSNIVQQHPDIIFSSLISANYTYRGIVTMVNFDKQLKQTNAKTISGVVFNSDVIQKELEEDLKDFADSLLKEVKK